MRGLHRRNVPLLVGIAALVIPGVALAATVNCTSSNPCNGTPGDDIINGTSGYNKILAQGGSDRPVYGLATGDEIHGAYGYDTMWGGTGHDVIIGGENGTTSWDRLNGEAGNNTLDDAYAGIHSQEADTACGLSGNDQITTNDIGGRTQPVETDYFWTGGGNDNVNADAYDRVASSYSACTGS